MKALNIRKALHARKIQKTKAKDEDYLYISTRLKALEQTMIPYERLLGMANADAGGEAVRILTECGWEGFDPGDLSALEERIAGKRGEVFSLLYRYAPDRRVIDLFRLRYDYHNIKTFVKAAVLQTDESGLYSAHGTIEPDQLEQAIVAGEGVAPDMKLGYDRARAVLEESGDPHKSDSILDAALSRQMLSLAENTGSKFLSDYVRLYIDTCNLKIFVRAARLSKEADYLTDTLLEDGNVPKKEIASPARLPVQAVGLFETFLPEAAVRAAVLALEGAALAALDKECDNALIEYMRSSRMVVFGEAHVVAYLFAKEQEFTAVRMIMTCRKAGYKPGEIVEKLRCGYV